MSTIIVRISGYLNKKFKGFLRLRKIAKQRNLKFSKKDLIAGNLIALDPGKKKLIHAKTTIKGSYFIIIDLNNVEHCSVQKQYTDINAGDLKSNKMSHFLKKIFLNLRFKNHTRTLMLPLYDKASNIEEDVQTVENKARNWQLQIAKLLPVQHLQTA